MKRENASPEETAYSGPAPLAGTGVLVAAASDTTRDPVVVVVGAVVVVLASDTTRDPVVVGDAMTVSDEVDVAVVVAETVGAEPVDAGVATVAFAEIGAVAATEERKADASDRAADAADGMATAAPP